MSRISRKVQFFLALLLFFLHGSLHSAITITNTTKSKGFSMELIDIDSIHSPLYPGNLTQAQLTKRRDERSISRHLWLKSLITTNGTTDTDQIRPTVTFNTNSYLVQLSIGTPPVPFVLVMDTGSTNIWLQCDGCNPCHPNAPSFAWKRSSSYFRIPCNDPMCSGLPCINNNCHFTVQYAQPATARGVLASETFTFPSSNPSIQMEKLTNVVFGCGFSLFGFPFRGTTNGILGLSKERGSLPNQLPPNTPRRFSYCLLPRTVAQAGGTTYLRFGEEAVLTGPGIQSTPFVNGPRGLYFLKLRDISINNVPMRFDPGFFDQGPNRGGVMIDSGSSKTDLKPRAYNRVEGWLKGYFQGLGLELIPGLEGLRLCYILPPGFNNFPTMTFHFDGGDLHLEQESVFQINVQEGDFCLGILSSPDDLTVLGAWQQQNKRFVYDLDRNVLAWQQADCLRNP